MEDVLGYEVGSMIVIAVIWIGVFLLLRSFYMWYSGITKLITQMKINNYLLLNSMSHENRMTIDSEKINKIRDQIKSEKF